MTFIVESHEEGMRLDLFLSKRSSDFSRTYFQQLIEKELVLVNQEVVKKRTLVQEGDEIEVEFPLTEEMTLVPEKMDLDILYEDEHLIAINKPAGLVVHPGCNNPSHTLVNGLLYHIRELQDFDKLRPGIVHRLDKDTTGIIICAKTRQAQEKMVALFAAREIQKEYLAITLGRPGITTIKTLIGRHPKRRQEMDVVMENGKEAETAIEILSSKENISLLRLLPKTGRTHQLRVHLKYINCPILGDSVYGNKNSNNQWGVTRQLLHAYCLTFIHPITGKKLILKAPIPKDMQTFLDKQQLNYKL